jgi:predicted secreted protein
MMERAVIWAAVLSMVVSLLVFGLAHADLFTLLIIGAGLYGLWRRFGHG